MRTKDFNGTHEPYIIIFVYNENELKVESAL